MARHGGRRLSIVVVALLSPLRLTFDYLVPENVGWGPLAPGHRVLVPFGRSQRIGIVVECKDDSALAGGKLKTVAAALEGTPVFGPEALALARWAAGYYQHPLGDVLAHMLPTWLRKRQALPQVGAEAWTLTAAGRAALATAPSRAARQQFILNRLASGPVGAIALVGARFAWRPVLKRLLGRGLVEEVRPAAAAPPRAAAVALNESQRAAVATINASLPGYRALVLQGVTGSGKTEVYLEAIAEELAAGRQALVLVPEIALTEQLVGRFRARFGTLVGLLHSALSERERVLTWSACANGSIRILVGTRSAVWATLPALGLIVVDEEHDPSYKQQDGFRYSARDIALVRAQAGGIPVILGSATPALETLANVERGKYQRIVMAYRARAAALPVIQLLDVRGLDLHCGLSSALVDAMRAHLERGEQVMLFLNRRGYSPLLLCRGCGEPQRCDRCDAYLVYHKADDSVHCHHCDRQWSRTRRARCCAAADIALIGLGTERIEEAVAELFPQARLCRIDRDTARRKDALRDMLARINEREVDVIIGTQMLAKGLDFAAVTLVGVVDTDSRLFSLDFRAEERLAQLLIQVAGRAGRAAAPGRVLVQTHQPHHPVLRQIIDQGYDVYAARALGERRAAGLPPYSAMAVIRADAAAPATALAYLAAARAHLLAHAEGELDLSYPLPALMERRGGRYRALMVVRAAQRLEIGRLFAAQIVALETLARRARVRWAIDVDPQDTL